MTIARFWTIATPEVVINNQGPGGGGGKGKPKNSNAGNKGGKGKGSKGNAAGWTGRGKATAMFMQSRKTSGGAAAAAYYLRASKTGATGSAGNDIDTYGSVIGSDTSDFNTTTGVWTVSQAGYYMIHAHGFNNNGLATGGEYRLEHHIDTGGGYSRETYGACSQNATPPSFGASAPRFLIYQFAANDKFKLKQVNDIAENVHLTIIKLPEDVIFRARKATGGGTRNASMEEVTNYDASPLEVGGSNFSTSTGRFTAPSDGIYFFYASAEDGAYTPGTHTPRTSLAIDGTTRRGYTISSMTTRVRYPGLTSIYLANLTAGQYVSFWQQHMLAGRAEFGGFKLPSTAYAFAADDFGNLSDNAAPAFYGGYATEDFDTGNGFNLTTGLLTAPRTMPWFFAGGARNNSTSSNPADNNVRFSLRQSGTTFGFHHTFSDQSNTYPHQEGTHIGSAISLSASDTVGMYQNDQTMRVGYFCGFELWGV